MPLAKTQLATIAARVMMDSEEMDSTAQVWAILLLNFTPSDAQIPSLIRH